MKPTLMLEYQTEGAPLLIADVNSFGYWTGSEHDGSEIIVDYVSKNFEALPQEFKTTKSPGRQIKKFTTVEQAEAFEKKLFPVLLKLHPEVKRPPKFPDASHSYTGNADVDDMDSIADEKRFSLERQQGSMFNTFAIEQFSGSVKVITFDKKNRAKGVLLDQGDNYGGFILADASVGTIVVALPNDEEGSASKVKSLLPSLCDPKVRAKAKAKPQGKISLESRVIVYDSSLSHTQLAGLNWKNHPFLKGAAAAFDQSGSGPLQYPSMKLPGGAFISVPAGEFVISFRDDVKVGGSSFQVLWLVHQ